MKGKKQKEPVGFNPAEIFAALALLEKERGIPQSFMMEKIIQALTTAYKRDHEGVENVIVDVDEAHQDLKMFVQKNVVEEEDYVDPANEMTVEEAQEALRQVSGRGHREHPRGHRGVRPYRRRQRQAGHHPGPAGGRAGHGVRRVQLQAA